MFKPAIFSAAICAGLVAMAHASEIRVTVADIDDAGGRIGCALHSAATGFPMGQNALQMIWQQTSGTSATCTFTGVAPGSYAISVANDLNGNGMTDTNVFGLPTEEWGVSGDVRPALRAPRFPEAAFDVTAAPVDLTVEVD